MPTINNGSQYFGVITYTGDGSSSKTVVDTNAIQFTPDFVWIKGRSGATDHALYDAVRGTTKQLESNTTTAETTESTGVTSFVNGGFTVGNLAQVNTSGATYVAWCWKANGAGSSNTQGSITSTVSVSTTAGFSVVTYTGTGANATVGHGLGVAPSMLILKPRSAVDNWMCYHSALGNTKYILLNSTNAAAVGSGAWNNTSPTSSVFTIGTSGNVNTNGVTMVAYCFADVSGYSKAFSYTGNGSTDGSFVFCGFRPKFVIWKRSDAAEVWNMTDTSINPYNVVDKRLYAQSSSAELTSVRLDILSNGFKLRTTDADSNASGGTYIGIAFAEHPFKNSNAR